MTAIANGTVWYNASLFIPSHDTEGWDNVVLVCIPNICFTMANMVWIHTVVILSLNERLLPVLDNPPDCSSLWAGQTCRDSADISIDWYEKTGY